MAGVVACASSGPSGTAVPTGASTDRVATATRGVEPTARDSLVPSSTPSPSPWSSPSAPDFIYLAEKACGGDPFDAKAVRPYSPDLPPYAGRGLHPAIFHIDGSVDDGALPDAWLVQPWEKTQLVVCEYLDESFRSRKVDTCTYVDGSTAEVRSARFVYRVFEARTAKLIGKFTLRGENDPCPAEVWVSGDSHAGSYGPYYEHVDSNSLQAKLRPFVTGRAR